MLRMDYQTRAVMNLAARGNSQGMVTTSMIVSIDAAKYLTMMRYELND
jgi:hypothetical protein